MFLDSSDDARHEEEVDEDDEEEETAGTRVQTSLLARPHRPLQKRKQSCAEEEKEEDGILGDDGTRVTFTPASHRFRC